MKNKIVVPTGYMGSGSSAVTDILSEIEGYSSNNGSYEFVFLHCPNGVFDLEDKLLIGNNSLRSDEAIHCFLCCMDDLYSKKFFWPGNYKKVISKNFPEFCRQFIAGFGARKMNDTFWYYQENPIGKMYFQWMFKIVIEKFSLQKILLKSPLQYENMIIAYPTSDEFYVAAKQFLNNIFNSLGYKKHNLVLDQLLLPHNLYRIDHYFDDELYAIVVDRDPRDVFVLNKYFWPAQGSSVPYPKDSELFCKVYKKIRKSEKFVQDNRILRIHFEDLIFNYNDTLKKIYSFLGVTEKQHAKRKGTIFNPKISIHNTQLYLDSELYDSETKKMQIELQEYLYKFPDIQREKRKEGSIF